MAIKLKKIEWRNIKLPKGVSSNLFVVSEAVIKHGWVIDSYEEQTYKLNISKFGVRMGVYMSIMTVQTAMLHPVRGKTQLTRKKITPKEFDKLLRDPRTHTGKGKYNLKPRKRYGTEF